MIHWQVHLIALMVQLYIKMSCSVDQLISTDELKKTNVVSSQSWTLAVIVTFFL